MYARNVAVRLKPNTLGDFTKSFETNVLPILRRQKGFQDEITFAMPGETDVVAISLWEAMAPRSSELCAMMLEENISCSASSLLRLLQREST